MVPTTEPAPITAAERRWRRSRIRMHCREIAREEKQAAREAKRAAKQALLDEKEAAKKAALAEREAEMERYRTRASKLAALYLRAIQKRHQHIWPWNKNVAVEGQPKVFKHFLGAAVMCEEMEVDDRTFITAITNGKFFGGRKKALPPTCVSSTAAREAVNDALVASGASERKTLDKLMTIEEATHLSPEIRFKSYIGRMDSMMKKANYERERDRLPPFEDIKSLILAGKAGLAFGWAKDYFDWLGIWDSVKHKVSFVDEEQEAGGEIAGGG